LLNLRIGRRQDVRCRGILKQFEEHSGEVDAHLSDPLMNAKPRRLVSPIYFLPFILLLLFIFHFVFPIQMILGFPFTLIGIAPLIIGLFINLQATRTLKNRTIFDSNETPRNLVTEGAFQYSRNPMYLGAIVLGFGLVTLLGSLVSYVILAVFFLLLHFLFIPKEEDQLKTLFGKEYLDYMKRVRKWI
jgi:protein-S-isoprenylcysteine O-methyltransferase Ste14